MCLNRRAESSSHRRRSLSVQRQLDSAGRPPPLFERGDRPDRSRAVPRAPRGPPEVLPPGSAMSFLTTREWLRRPSVGSVINRRLSPTSPRWSGSREFTPILAALRRFIASHAITDRRDDHVNVPTAPGAGHEEPVFPWDRADFRHHVLRLVREYVPAIMEELHTIADLRDPDQIRRDSDAGATRWPRDQPWITRTMHRTVRVWPRAPAMRASRQWGPCFLGASVIKCW